MDADLMKILNDIEKKIVTAPVAVCALHTETSRAIDESVRLQTENKKAMDEVKEDIKGYSQDFKKIASELTKKLDENILATSTNSRQLNELTIKIDKLENIEYKDASGFVHKQKLSDIIQDIMNHRSATYMLNKYGTISARLKSIFTILGIIIFLGYLALTGYYNRVSAIERNEIFGEQKKFNTEMFKAVEGLNKKLNKEKE